MVKNLGLKLGLRLKMRDSGSAMIIRRLRSKTAPVRARSTGAYPLTMIGALRERTASRWKRGYPKPGGDDGDLDAVLHLIVENSAEDDVGILVAAA